MSESLLSGDNSAPAESSAPASNTNSAPSPTPTGGNVAEIKFPENWKSALPDDLQKDPSMMSIMDVQSLAKSYVHAQKMIGKDKIVVPDKFATDDDWNKLFNKLGLPETVDKYEIKNADKFDKQFLEQFKGFSHKQGILPRHAEKVLEWYTEYADNVIKENAEQNKQITEQNIKSLQKEWGNGFDRKVQAAKGVFKQYADADMIKFVEESGFGNEPKVIKLFAKIAESLGEDKFIGEGNKNFGFTPEEAQAKINSVLGNKDHPYHNSSHPSHKDAINEVQKYFQMIYS
jgi:hypothetical protein